MSDANDPWSWKDISNNYSLSEKWGVGHWPYLEPAELPCTHEWANTGTNKTWCKKCDKDGDLDPMTGTVTVVNRPKHKENK